MIFLERPEDCPTLHSITYPEHEAPRPDNLDGPWPLDERVMEDLQYKRDVVVNKHRDRLAAYSS